MSGGPNETSGTITARHVVSLAFGLLAVLFALIPATQGLVFALLWLLAPVVAFGTLFQLFRGTVELRSGRGLLFAVWCGAITVVAMPLGVLLTLPTLGESLTFLGFLAAILATGFARLSVTDEAGAERELPPPDAVEGEFPDPVGGESADGDPTPTE